MVSTTRGRSLPFDVLVGRLTGAVLLAWMGWIHLHLWSQGYKHLPSIGYLFLVNFIVAVALALGVLATPRRFLALAAASGALLAAGTLVSLIISTNNGLLGFRDSLNAPFAHLSVWVEGAALVVLVAVAARSLRYHRAEASAPG